LPYADAKIHNRVRLMPVILSIDRILDPSANAAITAICLSLASTFAMRVNVLRLPLPVKCFCVTIIAF
jgi:hypothetical protein